MSYALWLAYVAAMTQVYLRLNVELLALVHQIGAVLEQATRFSGGFYGR